MGLIESCKADKAAAASSMRATHGKWEWGELRLGESRRK